MGELSEDLERCLCDCSCEASRTQQAKSSCREGRVRETKRVLLGERQRLLDEMHATQRGIDAIDHMLHRVSCECVSEQRCVSVAPEAMAGNAEGMAPDASAGTASGAVADAPAVSASRTPAASAPCSPAAEASGARSIAPAATQHTPAGGGLHG